VQAGFFGGRDDSSGIVPFQDSAFDRGWIWDKQARA
jgi:hypothetical protein